MGYGEGGLNYYLISGQTGRFNALSLIAAAIGALALLGGWRLWGVLTSDSVMMRRVVESAHRGLAVMGAVLLVWACVQLNLL
jgi:hypothetical protein